MLDDCLRTTSNRAQRYTTAAYVWV